MMTLVEMAVCVAVLSELSGTGNKAFAAETHKAIAENICAAANVDGIDPRLLAAYILTENEKFNPFENRPGVVGEDRGLYQANSHFHGARQHYEYVHHPYYATRITTSIIQENIAKFGKTWKAIAAYHNPKKAKEGTPRARRYYERWLGKYKAVEQKFNEAQKNISQVKYAR